MRWLVQMAWVALLLTVFGCETPGHDKSAANSGEAQRHQSQAAERADDEVRAAGEALAFESIGASEDGVREGLLYAAPSEPRALLWIFHGRGDSRDWCRRPHMQPALRAFYRAGFAVVCPQSVDRRAEAWDGGTRSRPGPDVANIRRARERLQSDGIVPPGLPEFGWGVSNGGGFVGTWAHHALAAGTDVRGVHCMIANCASAVATGQTYDLRIHWAAAAEDPFFAIAGVRSTHRRYDGPKSLVVADAAPLLPARLQSLAGLSTAESKEMHAALERDNLLDSNGMPSCDPKASQSCRSRLAGAYRSVDVGASLRVVRYAYENCRGTHTEFHTTCDGEDNTQMVLQGFTTELDE